MHFSDENSTIIEDDMTVDQKVQTTDFWTGRTIFQYGESSGSHKRFALASKKRPGPHRDKREAKNEKKAQRFKNIESVTERKPGCMTKPVNLVRFDMSSFLDSCVDAYCQLAKVEKSSLPRVQTPFTEAGIARPTLDEKETPGRLQPIASKVLMKILFAARMARPDLLRATQSLASRVTKWSAECDIALHRLVSYVNSSTDLFLEGFVGDSFDECQLWLFADADQAGEHDSKSTSGCTMFLVGPNTYFPLNAFSKKQTVVANSSTEAEVVSANHALRAEGIPMLALFEQLGIFKKLSQKAGVKSKPNTPEPEDPVFTRIDKEIDEIRYGNVDGGLSALMGIGKTWIEEDGKVRQLVRHKPPRDTIEGRALAKAGLTTVPQTSDLSEWMRFRRFLDKEEDSITGWEDLFRAVLSSATVNTMGSDVQALELAAGLMQCMTAHSDLQQIVKRNIQTVKDLMAKFGPQYGSHLRVISVIVWSGNELCGRQGIEPLPMWGQDAPEGDYHQLMADCKRHMTWWNDQLMALGVDQAAVVGEPDEMVYGLGMVFTHWMGNFKTWFHSELAPTNDRIRWIRNCVLPPSLELRDLYNASESEFNRRQMLEYYNSMFHLLHVTDILKPQIEMARLKPVRPNEDCIFRDVIPRKDEMPESIQQNMVRDAYVKVSKPTEYAAEASEFTAEEIRDRPPDFACQDDDDLLGTLLQLGLLILPGRVGKAKASHAAPESKATVIGQPSISAAAASSSSSGAPPKAAVAGMPAPENVIEGTVTPKFTIGQVPS
eukprot:s3220_g12.t1